MDTKSLFEEAMLLRPADRLQLIEMLARSLSEPNEDTEKAWAEESEKRYKALEAGRLTTVSWKEVIERYK